jgi:hypothetical protein
MTRKHLTFGFAGLALLVSSWSGCYFARDNGGGFDDDEFIDDDVNDGDFDNDGFFTPADCNDDDANVYPNAPENTDALCSDFQDNDCDGYVDLEDGECTLMGTGGSGEGGSGTGGSGTGGSGTGGSGTGGSGTGGSGTGGSSTGGNTGTGGSTSGTGGSGTGGSGAGGS